MEKDLFNREVEAALSVLQSGGVILYPTDTIWGLGCDATNEKAVENIYRIKRREDSKSLVILVAEERDVMRLVAAPDLAVFDFIEKQSRPTTVIYDQAIGLPHKVMAADGSVAIRIAQDEFCRHLVKRLRRPIVSTSANISGEPSPSYFKMVTGEIREAVDHIVQWRQDDERPSLPSQIIRWQNGQPIFLRK